MGLTKQDVREVLDVYIKAWETQDPDLIVTIFTPEATYHERVMEDRRSLTGKRSAGTGSRRWSRRRQTSPASC